LRIRLHRLHIVAVTSAAFALTYLSACNSRPSEKQIASAEDEVYEAVIRHITESADGRTA